MLSQLARALGFTLTFAFLALAACRIVREDEVPPASTDQPLRGGKVVIGSPALPTGVNELVGSNSNITTELIRQLFLQLVREQPDFQEHPPTFENEQLAAFHEFSPDHKTLTFTLRDDVAWSDGVPVTADDVRFTWLAQTSPEIEWASAYMKQYITDVEVVNRKTVRFHFSRVYVKQLADANEGVILPKHVWSRLPFGKWKANPLWFRRNLVVSGPFTVHSWGPGESVTLGRNKHYFRRNRPYLDTVSISKVLARDLMKQLSAGKVDFVFQIEPTDIEEVETSPGMKLIKPYWSRLYVCVVWNLRQPRFASAEVRQALTRAIDREAIVKELFPGGTGRVAISPIVQSVWAFNHDLIEEDYDYDPSMAAQVLKDHGWADTNGDGILDKNGSPFSFTLRTAGYEPRYIAALRIAEQLKTLQINVIPEKADFNDLVQDATLGNFDAVIFGFTMDTGLDMSGQFGSDPTKRFNFGGYKNEAFDALMAKAMRELRPEDARDPLYRLQRIIHEDQPVTFLWESQRLSAVRSRVHDARPNVLLFLYNLQDWWVDDIRGE